MNNVQITATSIVLFRRLDYNLSPLERFVFFRLWLIYSDQEIDTSAPLALAKEIGIHSIKLRNTIQLLIGNGMLECISENRMKVADHLNKNLDLKKLKIAMRQMSDQKSKGNLFIFISKLLEIIYEVRISHKQSQVDKLLQIDFKAWLILFCLIIHSDKNGIVIKVGMHELSMYTGMKRHAILRSLNKLFSLGLLRSKINGTLDNGILSFTSAIYLINLSHPIWGEYCGYRKFILIKSPSTKNLLKEALDVVNNLDKPEQLFPIKMLNYNQNLDVYQFENDSKALYKFIDEFNFALSQNEHFASKMHLSKFRSDISLKNTDNYNDNLQRLEFIFKYVAEYLPANQLYWSNNIELFEDLMLYEKIFEFKKYLCIDDFNTSSSALNKIPKKELIQILQTIQLKMYSFVTQYLLKNEVLPLIQSFQQDLCNIRPIPLAYSEHFRGYSASKNIEQDQLVVVRFEPDGKVYRAVCEDVEMTLENQKLFGLLDQSCTAITF